MAEPEFFGLPQWVWYILTPFSGFSLLLIWLAFALLRRRVSSFEVNGFGVSIKMRMTLRGQEPPYKRRFTDD